jgi:hypothetical protein
MPRSLSVLAMADVYLGVEGWWLIYQAASLAVSLYAAWLLRKALSSRRPDDPDGAG